MPEPCRTDRPKVLVVSDDQDAGELLTRLLDRAGWTTDLAYSAASGLSELDGASYSALVVDMVTTAQSIEVLRSVRGTPATAALPVLVCPRSPSDPDEIWTTGADGCLARPFEADELVAEVRAVIDRPDDQRDRHRQSQTDRSGPEAPA